MILLWLGVLSLGDFKSFLFVSDVLRVTEALPGGGSPFTLLRILRGGVRFLRFGILLILESSHPFSLAIFSLIQSPFPIFLFWVLIEVPSRAWNLGL